ncbi:MAG: class I SAM-dependent methyltransferase [Thermoplasmatota archaeon]
MRPQADIWDDHYRSGNPAWKGSPFPLPDLPRGSRILEVGCGTGSTIIQAAELGYDVTGMDISPAAVSLAGKRLERRGIAANVVVGDITNYNPDEGEFRGILLHHVLSSMTGSDRISAVKRSMELLKSGGVISFQDFSVEDMRYGQGEPVEKNTYRKGNGLICHFFIVEEVSDLFADLETVKLTIGRWPQRTGEGMKDRVRIVGIFQKT